MWVDELLNAVWAVAVSHRSKWHSSHVHEYAASTTAVLWCGANETFLFHPYVYFHGLLYPVAAVYVCVSVWKTWKTTEQPYSFHWDDTTPRFYRTHHASGRDEHDIDKHTEQSGSMFIHRTQKTPMTMRAHTEHQVEADKPTYLCLKRFITSRKIGIFYGQIFFTSTINEIYGSSPNEILIIASSFIEQYYDMPKKNETNANDNFQKLNEQSEFSSTDWRCRRAFHFGLSARVADVIRMKIENSLSCDASFFENTPAW